MHSQDVSHGGLLAARAKQAGAMIEPDEPDPDASEPSQGRPEPTTHLGRSPGRRWRRIGRGVHRLVRDDEDGDGLAADLCALQTTLPASTSFTHLTAAKLLGLWLPPLPDGLPLFIAMGRRHTRPERTGLCVSSHPKAPDFEFVEGVRCATPAEAILACARDLSLIDLVVLIDSALHLGLCTLHDLERAASKRRRGAPALREALKWCDGRSESAWETLLRILHVACGVEVEPQYEVIDVDGLLVARGDLWLKGTTMLHEYDGGDHLEKKRQRKDLGRARRLSHTDWERRGYTREDVLHQAVGVLRDADAAVGRPHEPGRIRVWHELLRDSLFTPAGTTRLHERLGLVAETSELGTA
jgi:hypothetical protein